MEQKIGQKIRIGEAAKLLGVSIKTLRNWEKSGKLRALRTVGGQRYYNEEVLKRYRINIETLGLVWTSSEQAPTLPEEYYCDRQDRFTSRLSKMGSLFSQSLGQKSERLASLLTLVAGEIGDNSFAHNIGNWPDVAGIFYAYDFEKRLIVLADRGRGIQATLKKVRPNIFDDKEALQIAFTEIVSGRAPEQRGNGLKVVRQVAEKDNAIGLNFRSGTALAEIPQIGGQLKIKMTEKNVRGVYAIIKF
ncbi:MAG: helix-turn-helix domain-containing protein [Patescibacteria group bacterium]